jgi:hypothetical protein
MNTIDNIKERLFENGFIKDVHEKGRINENEYYILLDILIELHVYWSDKHFIEKEIVSYLYGFRTILLGESEYARTRGKTDYYDQLMEKTIEIEAKIMEIFSL